MGVDKKFRVGAPGTFVNSVVKKNPVARLFHENKDIGFLVLRLFLGLRLFAGATQRIFQPGELNQFAAHLENHHVALPHAVVLLVFLCVAFSGLSFLLGYRMKIAATAMAVLSLFFAVSIPGNALFDTTMPPFATMVISIVFLFIPPGRFSLDHRLRTSQGSSAGSGRQQKT